MTRKIIVTLRKILDKLRLKVAVPTVPPTNNTNDLSPPRATVGSTDGDLMLPIASSNMTLKLQLSDKFSDFFVLKNPTVFAPLATTQMNPMVQFEHDILGAINKDKQAPNCTNIWSSSQIPRDKAMTGPRFSQIDISKQVSTFTYRVTFIPYVT